MTDYYWLDGRYYSEQRPLSVSPFSPLLQYGTGIVETLLWRRGKLFFFREHWHRLKRSSAGLFPRFSLNEQEASFQEVNEALVRKNRLWNETARIRWTVFPPAEGDHLHRWIQIRPLIKTARTVQLIDLSFLADHRLGKHKTVNYMFACVHGLLETPGRDYPIRNGRGRIIEAGKGNLAYVRRGVLYLVSERENHLPGVTQSLLNRRAGELFRKRIYRPGFSPKEIIEADELIYMNSILGFRRVNVFLGKRLPTSGISASLQRRLFYNGLASGHRGVYA